MSDDDYKHRLGEAINSFASSIVLDGAGPYQEDVRLNEEVTYYDGDRTFGFDCGHYLDYAPPLMYPRFSPTTPPPTPLRRYCPEPDDDHHYVDYAEARRLTEAFADDVCRAVGRMHKRR